MDVLKYIFYSSWLAQKLRRSSSLIVMGVLATLYYTAQELYGSSMAVFTRHPVLHQYATLALMFSTSFLIIFKGLGDYFEQQSDQQWLNFVSRFCQLTSKTVKKKLDRFKETIRTMSPGGDTFKKITMPEAQITLILGYWIELMDEAFSIKESGLCITVMRKVPRQEKWHFIFETNQAWKHTKAEVLLKESSSAAECLRIGEEIFHPDKALAAKQGNYYLSERDRRKSNGSGSAFCYPVKIVNQDYDDLYIISMVTYGQKVCSSIDAQQADAIKSIFCDLCRRIELELTLYSIKDWKTKHHSNRTREG